ncbi:MAG: hypothetical protein JXQ66_01075 [Campylobacterales bacterium]|nr:hypothetical protein [Campylobacterales bacterium]
MVLNPEVLTILILNIIFALFAVVAFYLSFQIYLKWDINSTSQTQYKLEKQSFLSSTIIKYIFIVKVPLFLFFIFTLDKLSNLITGAMCGAGVVDATPYGIYLLILKVLNIYIFAFWLTLHYRDIRHENLPYTKLKFTIFLGAFILLMAELILEGMMFSDIDINKMVSCCGTLYSNSSTSYISELFKIDTFYLLSSFYGVYLLMILFAYLKNSYIFSLLNFLFLFISIISLILFFGTYIYELPTHHCPFCFLQKDYSYVGYILYITLFLGTYFGIASLYVERYLYSLIFNSSYIVIVSGYVINYYLKNNVLL